MDYFEKLAAYCIEVKGAPVGFDVVEVGCVGGSETAWPPDHTHVEVKGAIYPPITKGPRKGKPNYRNPVEGSKRTYYLERAEAAKVGE